MQAVETLKRALAASRDGEKTLNEQILALRARLMVSHHTTHHPTTQALTPRVSMKPRRVGASTVRPLVSPKVFPPPVPHPLQEMSSQVRPVNSAPSGDTRTLGFHSGRDMLTSTQSGTLRPMVKTGALRPLGKSVNSPTAVRSDDEDEEDDIGRKTKGFELVSTIKVSYSVAIGVDSAPIRPSTE